MGVMMKHMKVGSSGALALTAALLSKAALAATAVGHVSVTILPSVAAVSETAPIELGGAGHGVAGHPGIVTLTGAPNSAVSISAALDNIVSGPGPAPQFARLASDIGRAPVLGGDGRLTFSVGTQMTRGQVPPQGAYVGSYSVIVNY
jgi:hypothetical protein